MKPRFIIGTAIIAVAFLSLVASSIRSNTLQTIPVHELRAADKSDKPFVGRNLRAAGFVAKDPVRDVPVQTPDGTVNMHRFVVIERGARLVVNYRDALPDTFRAGGPVQVEGLYHAAGEINASRVLTKCPSKYQSEERYKDNEKAERTASG